MMVSKRSRGQIKQLLNRREQKLAGTSKVNLSSHTHSFQGKVNLSQNSESYTSVEDGRDDNSSYPRSKKLGVKESASHYTTDSYSSAEDIVGENDSTGGSKERSSVQILPHITN